MKQNILVTVLMPVYNQEKYIKFSVESILTQTFPNFELLIIDDGCTDKSMAIVNGFKDQRIRVIKTPHIGQAGAMNIGLKKAAGKYVARIDADDIALPNRLQEQIAFLEANRKIVLVGSWVEVFDDSGKVLGIRKGPADPLLIRWETIFHNPLPHPSVCFCKEPILALGGYNPSWLHMEDRELFFKVAHKYQAANIPRVLLRYRQHPASLSQKYGKDQRLNSDRLTVSHVKQYLDMDESNILRFVSVQPAWWQFLLIYQRSVFFRQVFTAFIKRWKVNKRDRDGLEKQIMALHPLRWVLNNLWSQFTN
jgi:glycosyltransferase involved in cell wall biosynthesis